MVSLAGVVGVGSVGCVELVGAAAGVEFWGAKDTPWFTKWEPRGNREATERLGGRARMWDSNPGPSGEKSIDLSLRQRGNCSVSIGLVEVVFIWLDWLIRALLVSAGGWETASGCEKSGEGDGGEWGVGGVSVGVGFDRNIDSIEAKKDFLDGAAIVTRLIFVIIFLACIHCVRGDNILCD